MPYVCGRDKRVSCREQQRWGGSVWPYPVLYYITTYVYYITIFTTPCLSCDLFLFPCVLHRLNAAEQYVDVEKASSGAAAQWIAESGVLDLFLLTGPTPADVAAQYAGLTGTTAMPQLFSLGYHQCR